MSVQELLQSIREGFETALGDQLTGIYVHGSLAFECFNPECSDVDLIVAVKAPLSFESKKQLLEWILRREQDAPEKGLEMSVVLDRYCRAFVHPCPFEFHYSKGHQAWAQRDPDDYCRSMNGTDPDLAAHFTVIHAVGITLCGLPVQELFGKVPACDYLSSLRYDVENAAEEIRTFPVYIILNLCRIAAYVQEGAVLSKKQGGEWGREHLPEKFHPLISNALDAYTADRPYQHNDEEEKDFVTYMHALIFAENPSRCLQ